MVIFFHMLLPTSCASKWYQWLRIWLSRNMLFVGVNMSMSARNRHFQTNYWCITMIKVKVQFRGPELYKKRGALFQEESYLPRIFRSSSLNLHTFHLINIVFFIPGRYNSSWNSAPFFLKSSGPLNCTFTMINNPAPCKIVRTSR